MSRTALISQRVGDWVPEHVLLFSLENDDSKSYMLDGKKRMATEP